MNLHTQLLNESHRDEVRNLYLLLDKESIYRRFGTMMSQELVTTYVNRLAMTEGLVIGAFDGAKLVGICEAMPFHGENGISELAFVVDPAYRGRKVGFLLGTAMLRDTSDKLVVACMSENQPMAQLANKLGFLRVGRGRPGPLPAGLVDDMYTPYGLFAGEGELREAA